MGALAIVIPQPFREHHRPLAGGMIGRPVGPPRQAGPDKALSLPIGLGPIGPGAGEGLRQTQLATLWLSEQPLHQLQLGTPDPPPIMKITKSGTPIPILAHWHRYAAPRGGDRQWTVYRSAKEQHRE